MTELNRPTPPLPYSLFLGGLALLVCIGFFAAQPWPGVTNDVTQVIDVAQNMAAGNGIATDSLYYTEHFVAGDMPTLQTVFPPGQSFLVSLAIRLGIDPIKATQFIAAIGFLIIPNMLFLLCIRAGVGTQTAVATSILWLCLILAWSNTLSGKSDVPFIGLTIVSAALLVRRDDSFFGALLAGIFAAFALSFRYAGLFFMAAVAVTMLIEWVRTKTRNAFIQLCAFSVPSGAAALLLFYRNYTIVGDIKGGNNYAVSKTVVDICRNVYRSFSSMMGLDYARLPAGSLGEWLFLIAMVLGVVIFIGSTKPVRTAVSKTVENRSSLLCIVYPLVTVAMLLLLEVKSQPGSRDRMFMAMMPFAFCFGARLLDSSGPTSRVKLAMIVLAVLSFLLGQAQVAEERFNQPRHDHHWYRMNRLLDTSMDDGVSVREFLQKHISNEHPLLGNESQRLGLIVDRPVVGLPSYLYTPSRWTNEEVHELVKKYDVQYVLVLTDVDSLDYEEIDFYVRVADGEVPDWMEPHFKNGYVELYRVK